MTGPHVFTDLMDQNFSSLKELALLVLGVSVGGFGSRFGFSNLFSGGLFDYLFRSLLCNRSVLGWSILGRSLFSRCRLRGRLHSSFGFLHGGLLRAVRLENELDYCHRRVVALAVPDLGDAGVTAGASCHSFSDVREQLVDDRLVTQIAHNATASVQVATLGESDHALSVRTKALGAGLRGGDPLVLEQARCQIGKNEPLVRRSAAETRSLGGRRHLVVSLISIAPAPASRWRPQPNSASGLVSFRDVFPAEVRSGRYGVDVSGAVLKRQTQFVQFFLHLGDRLLPKVADVHQVQLGARS